MGGDLVKTNYLIKNSPNLRWIKFTCSAADMNTGIEILQKNGSDKILECTFRPTSVNTVVDLSIFNGRLKSANVQWNCQYWKQMTEEQLREMAQLEHKRFFRCSSLKFSDDVL